MGAVLAAMYLAAGSTRAAEVIVDNTDAGFSILSGTWTTASSASGKYGTNYRYAATANPANALAQWQPTIPVAGDYQVFVWYPAGSNRIANVQYTIYHSGGSQTVSVDQTVNAGTWVPVGTFPFAAGSSAGGRVTISNYSTQSSRRVYADAVRFFKPEQVTLTMAVNPPGSGTTTPAVGGPYAYMQGDVVALVASPAAGYLFDRWTVSAGVGPANPTAASTTLTLDVTKTVTAHFKEPPAQFRGVWVDAFHAGYKSKAEIDALISRCLTGRYNAIIPEVLAFHDTGENGHGAYWNSAIVPKAADIVTAGLPNGDPLLYLVQQARAHGLEVHCWLVAFRVSSTWPPAGNSTLAARPEWICVPQAAAGGGPAQTGGYYVLDPGSPDVQNYLMSIIRELCTNYEIDGINWDYIRYTQTDGGYPADMNYPYSSLRRFQRIAGRSDVPPPTGDAAWNDFRRRTIDEIVRRTRAEMASVTSNPRQPLRFSCDLITWGAAPASFTSSSAYTLFSNWEFWMRQGYLDAGMPMAYYREYNSTHAGYYRSWVKACLNWRYQRHMYIGQANYLNTMADSVTQLAYALQTDESPPRSADGTVNYSYYSTVDSNMDGSPENDWNWYSYVGANLFTHPAAVPAMPWRNPATATEGTLWGRITLNGVPVDNAAVQVGSLPAVLTDGAGYYVVTLIPAATGGSTLYQVTATRGADTATVTGVAVFAGDTRRQDIDLGGCTTPPIIGADQHPKPQAVCRGGTATFTVMAHGCGGPLSYRWRRNGAELSDGGHCTGTATPTLTVAPVDESDLGEYSCAVTDSAGTTVSNSAPLSLLADTTITQHPMSRSVCPGTGISFTVAATGAGSSLLYQWKRNGVSLINGGRYGGVASPTLTISNVEASDVGEYHCVVTGACGVAVSNPAMLTLLPVVAADFDANCAVDAADLAIFRSCLSGADVSYVGNLPPGCPQLPDATGRIAADFDGDRDVDLSDFGIFQRCLSGAGTAPQGNCAD